MGGYLISACPFLHTCAHVNVNQLQIQCKAVHCTYVRCAKGFALLYCYAISYCVVSSAMLSVHTYKSSPAHSPSLLSSVPSPTPSFHFSHPFSFSLPLSRCLSRQRYPQSWKCHLRNRLEWVSLPSVPIPLYMYVPDPLHFPKHLCVPNPLHDSSSLS